MKVLNLTKGFKPYTGYGEEIKFSSFIFSGGEPHIKIDVENLYLNRIEKEADEEIIITIRLNSFNDLGLLAVAVDAITRLCYFGNIHLIVPYFPGARQDRVMVKGEPLTAKVYADIINNMGFASIDILDPHSDVVPALLDGCVVKDNHEFVKEAIGDICDWDGRYDNFWLVSPDAGANKKVLKLAQHLEHEFILKCDKVRDVSTGSLNGFEVYKDDLGKRDCIIVDDICDGGGTFIGLAEELKKKNAGDLYLIVTHGIFSKGFKELAKHFKGIYTTNSIVNNYAWDIPEIEKGSEIVKIINI